MITIEQYETNVVEKTNEILTALHSYLRVHYFKNVITENSEDVWYALPVEIQNNIKNLENELVAKKNALYPFGDSVIINMETGEARIVNENDTENLSSDEIIVFTLDDDNIYDLDTFVDDNDCGVEVPNLFKNLEDFVEYGGTRYEDAILHKSES